MSFWQPVGVVAGVVGVVGVVAGVVGDEAGAVGVVAPAGPVQMLSGYDLQPQHAWKPVTPPLSASLQRFPPFACVFCIMKTGKSMKVRRD